MSDNLLDEFLSLASSSTIDASTSKKQLKETDIFSQDCNNDPDTASKIKNDVSNIHGGETDSSDDEDNKYYEDRRYNECGREIKHLLKSDLAVPTNINVRRSVTWKNNAKRQELAPKQPAAPKTQDVYADPIFGLRIVNPVVSSSTLQERMIGREAITLSKIKNFVLGNLSDKNWVIAGVIVNKSCVKTSQKGSQFLIWTVSDLKDDIKTVSIFLFNNAYKQLWKTATGTVVGILNPSVLERKSGSKDEATLSIDNAQKVMILGQSKDLGRCKSIKKNGEQCSAIVNVNRCEYCIFHIKQEYQKCSRRSELQSSFAGKGLTALRNKVLGKNEVFYAGKSYTAIPAKRNRKLEEKDENRLLSLGTKQSGNIKAGKPQRRTQSKVAANIETSTNQRLKDLALLKKLGVTGPKNTSDLTHSAVTDFETSKKTVNDVLAKLKANNSGEKNCAVDTRKETMKNSTQNTPLLSCADSGFIDLSTNIATKHVDRAKLNALKYIKNKGTLKKTDPNAVKKPTEAKKRSLETTETQNHVAKKPKILENEFLSDRFKKMMEATSRHSDLLDVHDNEEQDKYFHKLEKKEQMEEKMINTYKVPCKAVRCLQCKYTNFSASQFCKENKHALRVFDAVKRFFKCGNRTVSLEVVPMEACKNCGSGKWERTGMMKERMVGVGHTLSIRGGEQKFINSVATDANLDLLVPDL